MPPLCRAMQTWGSWLVACSLLAAPFWFNPLSFSTSKVKRDWRGFTAWLHGETDGTTNSSWYTYNRYVREAVAW